MSVGVMGVPCPNCLCITSPDSMETVYCRKCKAKFLRKDVVYGESAADVVKNTAKEAAENEAKGTELEFAALGSITMSTLSIIEQQINILIKKKLFPKLNFSWEEDALCRGTLPGSFPQPNFNPLQAMNAAQIPVHRLALTEEDVKARILFRFGDTDEGAEYLKCFALLYNTMEKFVKEAAKDKIKKAAEA